MFEQNIQQNQTQPVRPALQKLATPTWIKEEPAKQEEKPKVIPEPKKIDDTFVK
jgi:hypothetical protein